MLSAQCSSYRATEWPARLGFLVRKYGSCSGLIFVMKIGPAEDKKEKAVTWRAADWLNLIRFVQKWRWHLLEC